MLPPSPVIKGLLPLAGSTPLRAPGPHDLAVREPSPPMIFSGPRTSPQRLSTTVLLRRSSARSLCSLEERPSLEPDRLRTGARADALASTAFRPAFVTTA